MRFHPQLTIAVVSSSILIGCHSTITRCPTPIEPPTNPEHTLLREKLIELRDRDQEIRNTVTEAWQRVTPNEDGTFMFDEEGGEAMRAMNAIDSESSAFLKAMIAQHGWPTIDMVGDDGAHAAWLLAQHADAEPELQQKVLELMEPLVERGQASGALFAMLTDRVLSGKGEPQVYGTQFGDDSEGVLRPYPTVDWERVDERRARVGLSPISEYAIQLADTYNQPVDIVPLPTEPHHEVHK